MKLIDKARNLKVLHSLLLTCVFAIGFITIIASGGGGDGGSGTSDDESGDGGSGSVTITTAITSGTAVATAKPATTTSSDSPTIDIISYENVVSPGGLLSGQISYNDPNGDVEEIIIAEQGVNKYNEIIVTSASGITNGQIDYNLGLSNNLNTEEPIEFDIGLKDNSNNISNYQTVEVYLSDDTKYATTSYSGDSNLDVSGEWNLTHVVTESNPVYPVGTSLNTTVTISQSGTSLTLADKYGSYSGKISGNDQLLTITFDGTMDMSSEGVDVFVDFWGTFSGEAVNSSRIEGESNSIIESVYGDDADEVGVYPVATEVIMTRSGVSGEGRIEGQITYDGYESGWHALFVVIKNLDYSDVVSKRVSLFTISEDSLDGYGFSYIFNEIPSGGPYYVFAYWDVNDNGYYDNDPAGYYVGAISVSYGSEQYDVDIELQD